MCVCSAHTFPPTLRGISLGTERHFWKSLIMIVLVSCTPVPQLLIFISTCPDRHLFRSVCKHRSGARWHTVAVVTYLSHSNHYSCRTAALSSTAWSAVEKAKNNPSHNKAKGEIDGPRSLARRGLGLEPSFGSVNQLEFVWQTRQQPKPHQRSQLPHVILQAGGNGCASFHRL